MTSRLRDHWGVLISPDTGANAIRKESAVLDEAMLFDEEKGVAGFIKNILAYEPDNTFLDVLKTVPAKRLSIFFNVILSEKSFIDTLRFNETEQPKFDELLYSTAPNSCNLLDYAMKQKPYNDCVEPLLRATSSRKRLQLNQSQKFKFFSENSSEKQVDLQQSVLTTVSSPVATGSSPSLLKRLRQL